MSKEIIYRDDAIDALYTEIIKRRLMDDVNDGMLDEFDTESILRKLPSAEPEPQWIPCSERLPEESGQYYVSGGDKVWICEFLIIQNFIGGWCNDVANPVVQAWMPLPEPWKGGQP